MAQKKIKIIMILSMNSNNCETVTTDLRELILADALLPTEYRVCMNYRVIVHCARRLRLNQT